MEISACALRRRRRLRGGAVSRGGLIWPQLHPIAVGPSALCRASKEDRGGDAIESGAVRADPQGHDLEGLSIHALARRYRVHRRTVRQALASPLPPERKRPEGRPAPKLGRYRKLIDGWLIADREVPRKQRHTARRIWERLRGEHGADVAERTVREYVAGRKRELGLGVGEVCVPLCHEPGAEAEVDWGEATVVIAGIATKVFLFLMRACFSGACFVQAFRRETRQTFLRRT